jgi:hypothetical protein
MTAASLRTRIAGQRAMREVVDAEAAARPRTRLERLFGIRALSPAARRAYDTALGDAAVGPALEQLGQRWDVLHDVPVGGGRTIDHIAIGPGGVFAVRAVHCAGADVVVEGAALTIGGVARDDLVELAESSATAQRLLAEATAASAPAPDVPVPALHVPVRALFVVVDAARIVTRVPPDGVQVIQLPHVRRTLGHARPRLPGDVVASISDLADRPTTWPVGRDDDAEQLHREFQWIRDRVRVALRRRMGWAIAVFAVGACTMFGAIAAYVTVVALA